MGGVPCTRCLFSRKRECVVKSEVVRPFEEQVQVLVLDRRGKVDGSQRRIGNAGVHFGQRCQGWQHGIDRRGRLACPSRIDMRLPGNPDGIVREGRCVALRPREWALSSRLEHLLKPRSCCPHLILDVSYPFFPLAHSAPGVFDPRFQLGWHEDVPEFEIGV